MTSTSREELIQATVDEMSIVTRTFRRFRNSGNEELFELTMPQLRAVMCLEEGPAHMSRLASALGVSLPSATGIVDRLVQRGLVQREEDPRDRRLVICELTSKGGQVTSSLYEADRAVLQQLLGSLAHEDLKIILQALNILNAETARLAASHQ